MSLTAVTIAARAQLVQARALARSLDELGRRIRLYVLIVDDRATAVDATREPFELVRPGELDLPRYELLAGIHALPQLADVIRPAVLRHILDRTSGPVVSLGVDTLAFGDLRALDELAARASLVVVPRLQAAVPRDHVRLQDIEIMQGGIFDRDLLVVSPGAETDHFLRAWSDRLELDADDERPLISARFLDLAPAILSACEIVRDPGLGVSAVNLHERPISLEGGFHVDGRPLRLVHFEGLPEPTTAGAAALADARERLIARERERLLARDGAEPGHIDYGYGRLADGTELSEGLRRWIRDAELYGGFTGSPFDAEGTTALLAWLNGPAPQGARWGITRYWHDIYSHRPDLQVIHPDLDGGGGPGFLRWAQDAGAPEYATPPSLLVAPVLS